MNEGLEHLETDEVGGMSATNATWEQTGYVPVAVPDFDIRLRALQEAVKASYDFDAVPLAESFYKFLKGE